MNLGEDFGGQFFGHIGQFSQVQDLSEISAPTTEYGFEATFLQFPSACRGQSTTLFIISYESCCLKGRGYQLVETKWPYDVSNILYGRKNTFFVIL